MGKRILLFMLTNILVVVTLSIVLRLLGVDRYMGAYGLNYPALIVFCFVWGMGGAFISLLMSKFIAKWSMSVKVVDPRNPGQFQELLTTVHDLAQKAGLPAMPEVGVYDSPEVNAFATGPSRGNSLVAVSTGLLQSMDRSQVEGVLGHEVAHIANGDMVTMALIQGVINAFVMFLARVIGFVITQSVKEESRRMVNFLVVMVLEIGLSFLGMMVVAWFSRQREFKADAGGARFAGKGKMLAALQGLRRASGQVEPEGSPAMATMKISSGKKAGFMAMLSTHPPLEERIARLQESRD